MGKLTKAQRELLARAVERTFPDGTGSGAILHDGRMVRTANLLAARGLLMPVTDAAKRGHHLHGARPTPAGRAALARAQETSR